MKLNLNIPWIGTDQAVHAQGFRPAGEWDHTAQLDLHEAEATLGELRELWQQEKARREQRPA